MKLSTGLKLGQVAGVLLLCWWFAAYLLTKAPNALLFLAGAGLYGGCRLAAWLKKPD